MLEVASPFDLGGLDRRSDEIWPASWFGPARCGPLDPYASQFMSYIDPQPLRDSIGPRASDIRNVTSSMRIRSPVRLSVQPAKVKAKQRRRPAPRRGDDQQRLSSNAQPGRGRVVQSQPPEPSESNVPIPTAFVTDRFPDTLFSSIASESGRAYDPKNLCDLCRRPFEDKEDDLYAHLCRHLRDLDGSLSCGQCQIQFFAHEGDLKWHQQSSGHGDHSGQVIESGADSTDRISFCVRLRKWEQVQLQLHSRTIDKLCQTRSGNSRPRPSSLPPRERMPLSITVGKKNEIKHIRRLASDTTVMTINTCPNNAYEAHDDQVQNVGADSVDATWQRNKTIRRQLESRQQSHAMMVDQNNSSTKQAVYSLQRRILDLMEKVQPDPSETDDQPTPYSEFCDSHSLPGSPENYQGAQHDRATSEPPVRTQGVEEYSKRAVPYNGDSERGRTGGSWDLGSSNTSQGQKRGSGGHHSDQWERDDSNGPLQPKKRKTVSGNTNANEKRFPCIFHIGEPERFAKDLARHKHISNMLRHLKSHDFYACSTCIVRLSKHEDLDIHSGQHTKACSKKGCKRTKPAGHYVESMNCAHIMDGEDQWRALFNLQFNRVPPTMFNATDRNETNDTVYTSQGADIADLTTQNAVDIGNDSSGVYTFPDSFFDQAMDFDLTLPDDGTESATPLLDMNEFLVLEPAQPARRLEERKSHGAVAIPIIEDTQAQEKRETPIMPAEGGLATLEHKVTALEGIISAQTNKDKDRIFSLQEKVVQLEQKLFQSSEREQQLEATLGVIFDALQRTGDSRAQPSKALWNLVMSHSSQAIGSVSGTSERNEGKREKPTPEAFLPISPSLTFKTSVQTPPDSAYGSIR